MAYSSGYFSPRPLKIPPYLFLDNSMCPYPLQQVTERRYQSILFYPGDSRIQMSQLDCLLPHLVDQHPLCFSFTLSEKLLHEFWLLLCYGRRGVAH